MNQMTQRQFTILAILCGVTVLFKVLPHALTAFGLDIDPSTSIYPWNFSPLLAVGLFCGAMVASRRIAIMLPLISLFIADAAIAMIQQDHAWLFYNSALLTYPALVVIAMIGMMIPKKQPVWSIAAAGVASAVAFFLISNFAVWAMPHNGVFMYPMTFNGLISCYVAAIPFYKNTLIAMAIYLPLLFHPMMISTWQQESEPEGELVPQQIRES